MTDKIKRKIDSELWIAISVSIVAGGLAAFITMRSLTFGVFLDAAILSAGVFLLVYAAISRRRYLEEIEEMRFQGRSVEPIPMPRYVRHTFLGVALILAAIAGLLSPLPSGFRPPVPPSPGQLQSLVQLLDK